MPLDAFLAEVASFHRLLGQRAFWELDEKHHDGAMRGLTFGYFKVELVAATDLDTAASAYEAAINEYERRAAFRAIHQRGLPS